MRRLPPRSFEWRQPLCRAAAALALLGAAASALAQPAASLYLGSKSPYAPLQDATTYEAPPAGFVPIYTELVARHGSRGLSSASSDLALFDMWSKANAAGALTKLGQRLGPDLQRLTRANALLGYGVAGIGTPGYGNLTQVGIAEHRNLATRLASRVAPLLDNAAAQARSAPRQVVVSTSGVNRAVDSANFFTQSLAAAVPGLAPLIVKSPALTAYPAPLPVAQAAGVNRFQLYFHKLTAATDLPPPGDGYTAVYQSSRAYQNYLATDAAMAAKVNGTVYSPASKAAARAALQTVFGSAFIDALDAGTTRYANTGSFRFTSDDGLYTATVTGDGTTTLGNLVDAANALYAVYSITPAMAAEVPLNLGKYLPDAPLQTLAYLSDVQDFYQKGPGIAEAGNVNSATSQALLDDFFNEVDAVAAGNLAHAAKLRFTHAEIVIPFATRLGLPWAATPVPAAQDFSYAANDWRGERVAPLAANIQWDVYRGSGGQLLVKMLYNERETDFAPACEAARYLAGSTSRYYDYGRLKACYGHVASAATARSTALAEGPPMNTRSHFLAPLLAPVLASVLGAASGSAGAATVGTTNLVTNGSFELGTAGLGSFAGWQTRFGDAATFVDSSGQTGRHPGQASDGLWSAYFGSTGASGGASISQQLATVAGQSYLLSFELANDNGGAAAANAFTATVGGGVSRSFAALGVQDYARQEIGFTAASGTTLLTFSGVNDNGYLQLDNVAVTAAVPEPAAAWLTGAGLGLLALAAGHRRARTDPAARR